jgi:hypothetical protein
LAIPSALANQNAAFYFIVRAVTLAKRIAEPIQPTLEDAMAQDFTGRDNPKKKRNRLWKMFVPLVGVTAALGLIGATYFTYDIAKGAVSPCDSIFQEASVGLTTKIKFLKAEGELKLGREKVTELSERAQMTALSLKTCCIVLDAGRVNPEQFLECRSKAREYDTRVENVVSTIRTASANPAKTVPGLDAAIEAARATSRELNRQVVEVSKEQSLQTLQTAQAKTLSVDAAESEPNDDALNANLIGLNKQVRAAISSAKEGDVFAFTTPETYRDWIHIDVLNQSTTLEPHLELFDASKTLIGSVTNTTHGGDLGFDFVAPPSSKFSVKIRSRYLENTGVYVIRIAPKKAYDAFEPNDDILSARRIAENTPVKAGIMDKYDADLFSIAGAATGERKMKVTIANASATLHPRLTVYDAAKTQIGLTQNATAGGDVSFSFKAPQGPVYLRVNDYYSESGGDYVLTIAPE